MRVAPPVLIKNLRLLCLVTGLGTASAACATTESQAKWIVQSTSGHLITVQPRCMRIPEQPLDFGDIQTHNLKKWVGLEKLQFMTNTSYLAVELDESGRSYLRQKLQPVVLLHLTGH